MLSLSAPLASTSSSMSNRIRSDQIAAIAMLCSESLFAALFTFTFSTRRDATRRNGSRRRGRPREARHFRQERHAVRRCGARWAVRSRVKTLEFDFRVLFFSLLLGFSSLLFSMNACVL